jgi:uncharacterized protein (DUF4415 family)
MDRKEIPVGNEIGVVHGWIEIGHDLPIPSGPPVGADRPDRPDTFIGDAAFWQAAELLYPKAGKWRITLRLDADVLDWFKSGGQGYQTRINAILRAFMQARRANNSHRRT